MALPRESSFFSASGKGHRKRRRISDLFILLTFVLPGRAVLMMTRNWRMRCDILWRRNQKWQSNSREKSNAQPPFRMLNPLQMGGRLYWEIWLMMICRFLDMKWELKKNRSNQSHGLPLMSIGISFPDARSFEIWQYMGPLLPMWTRPNCLLTSLPHVGHRNHSKQQHR